MREFQVLGITLTDYSVKEAMKKVETYIRNGQVSTLCYITASGLLEAEDHPKTKEFLEDMSLTIAADPEVLNVAGITQKSRIREIRENEFIRQFLGRIHRENLPVCLLSDHEESLGKLEAGILSFQSRLNIIGRFALEGASSEDSLINDINVLAPTIIISDLSYPAREEFYSEHHMKLHAEIWLILKHDMVLDHQSLSLWERIRQFFSRKALKRSVDQYNKEESAALEEEKKKEQEHTETLLKFDTQEFDTEAIEKELAASEREKTEEKQ
ncbi:MAG: hypothetical protein K6E18_07855 [Lachnospiraceae bacterium]|nr:hypothetical protein [Lachnospiraceae bacterium]